MKWAMKRGVGVSRTGAVWLIRRHIDAAAEFLWFDDDAATLAGASQAGARTVHVKGGDFHKRDGLSTIGTLIERYGLAGTDPALDLWSEIVRDAEGPLRKGAPSHPEAFGFYCLLIGYRELPIDEDERGRLVELEFEALYQWCRKVVARDIVPPRTSPHGEPPVATAGGTA